LAFAGQGGGQVLNRSSASQNALPSFSIVEQVFAVFSIDPTKFERMHTRHVA